MWPLWLVEMSLQHIQKNSSGLLPKPAKFEKNPPNGYRVIRKTKCGAGPPAEPPEPEGLPYTNKRPLRDA